MLRPWPLPIVVDRRAGTPVGQQIVHAVIEEVRRGRLKPGTPLPGSRELGETLGVNRKTVVQAYGELEAQGWVATEPRRGTFVAENLPLLELAGGESPQIAIRSASFFHLPPAPAPLAAD